MSDDGLDDMLGPRLPPVGRVAKSREKGAWRFMADGSPSSDGIHADIAGACRLIWGPPLKLSQFGIMWWSVEQRRKMSKGENFIAQARGCGGGGPELYIWDANTGRMYVHEVKRPAGISPKTGRKVQAEELTDAQKIVHPEFRRAHLPIYVQRSRDEFLNWVRERGLPHRHVTF